MCGIVGFLGDRDAFDRVTLEAACRVIRHRGPDASNVYWEPGVGLGHQRLSIIDLTDAANQPMLDPTGRVVLVYNGELYNYRELRELLQALGHNFRTHSDTEVLLHAYLEYGEQCLSRLQGMFAFALWDGRNRTLLLARDRLGIKPLYYHVTPRALVFASEIKAILAVDGSLAEFDRQALHDYLTFRYTISPRTMFAGVSKLPPAHYMIVTDAGVRTERYWAPDYRKTEQRSDEEWIVGLRRQLTDCVRSHLVADVPVGVLLSGGLDSSVMAAAMQAQLTNRIKTFSVAFSEGGLFDERPFARKVAQHLQTDHHEICITAKDFMTALPEFVWHMDEPVADPAAIPLYYVSKLASEQVRVVLSGEGSDELLGGYAFWSQYKGYDRLRHFKMIPSGARKLLRWANARWVHSPRFERYCNLSDYPLSSYATMVPEFQDHVFTEEDKRQLYRLDMLGLLYVSMMQWLPEDLLVKADKMTMAHSLELRVPFLDHTFVEYTARMPTGLKVKRVGAGYSVKYALKQAFKEMLPQEIVEREKLGFPVPYAKWFRDEMREMVRDILLSQSARESGLFRVSEIERLLNQASPEADSGGIEAWNPHAKKIWSLFVFELWRKAFHVTIS
jgi:asparagine synthase (glutamine-hydrolysing)